MNIRNLFVTALLLTALAFPAAALAGPPNGELRAVLELQRVISEKVGNTTAQAKIDATIARLGELNQADPQLVSDIEAAASELIPVLEILVQKLDEVSTQGTPSSESPNVGAANGGLSTPLTPADYFRDASCAANGTERFDDLTVFISEQALFVAETVREEASRICDETIVFLGEGGNTSLLCIATDIIYIVAKETHNVLTFCDGTVDSAEIEGAFERTADIYDNLNEHDANLAVHDANLALHDAEIKALLAVLQAGVDENTRRLGEVIRLLHTPQGLRSSDTPVCDGEPCDFPEVDNQGGSGSPGGTPAPVVIDESSGDDGGVGSTEEPPPTRTR